MSTKSFGVREINIVGSAGTPTIESPGILNINATNVAISTNLTVGGDAYIGSGSSTGVILTAPNGNMYRLAINNLGSLTIELV